MEPGVVDHSGRLPICGAEGRIGRGTARVARQGS